MALANDGGFNFEKVAKAISAFLHLQGGQVDAGVLISQVPEIKNMLSGRRLVPFLQRFPERFELTTPKENVTLVKVILPVEESADAAGELVFTKDVYYNDELAAGMINGIIYYMGKQGTPAAPCRWLYAHRAIPRNLKGWALTHPHSDWNYYAKPDLGGFKDEAAARTGSLLAYMKGFVDHNSATFKWVDKEKGMVTLQEGVMAPEKKKEPEKIKMSHVSAATMQPDEVQDGSYMLVTRISSRTRELNKLEMQLMSSWAGLPQPPKEVKAGLLCVPKTEESTKFINNISVLTSVRRCCSVICSATTEEAFLHKLQHSVVPCGTCSVAFEVHYPETNSATLPFHDVTRQAMLMSKVMGILGTEKVTSHDDGEHKLVLIALKGFYMLGLDGSRCSEVQAWNSQWEGRPFFFSGSMEASVASGIVSVAKLAYGIERKKGLLPDSVLDACCGSGTLATAAAIQGVPNVTGFELREDFVPRIKENLVHTKITNVTVLCHDCTLPSPVAITPSLVFCNAPWGKKFGTEQDCAKVVRGVLSHYLVSSLICFIIPGRVLNMIKEEIPITVLHAVPLGTVSLFIVKAA
eukprot:TRINITY_DN3838_c0_g1_i1.p1 TRINITY_DN3838_c0_g1~~TRINITY_DN3838_c0_g1_i1.p1  ORF type:complete len:579 (+),score=123.39 TRINITY_DN3838_c0_g1_i1:34-1770(+)